MPIYRLEETQVFDVLPVDTIIQVEVVDVSETPVPGKNNQPGWMKLDFKFRIVEIPSALQTEYGSVIDSNIWGSCSAKFTDHIDNKLRQWSEALLGISVNEPGFELDTDILVGRKARAVTMQYERRDQTFQHKIATLLPAVAVVPVAPAPVVPIPEPVLQQTLDDPGWTDDPPF